MRYLRVRLGVSKERREGEVGKRESETHSKQ